MPVAGISAVPFACATHEDAWRTMDGPLGKFVHAAVEPVGLYAFDKAWDAGFRQLENNVRPIGTAKDIQGLKIRVADSPIETALFKGLGASPTQVNGSEQYVALQTHLVDGTGVPLSVISTRKMYEVPKFGSITNHMWTGYMALASAITWQRLPDSLHAVCSRYLDAAAIRETLSGSVPLPARRYSGHTSRSWPRRSSTCLPSRDSISFGSIPITASIIASRSRT